MAATQKQGESASTDKKAAQQKSLKHAGGNVFLQSEELSLAPLHACNIVFEMLLMFTCVKSEHRGKSICVDSFAFGSGSLISLLTLVYGQADTNIVSLQAICWYHFVSLSAQVRRSLLHESLAELSNFLNLGHLAFFLLPVLYLVSIGELKLDSLFAIVSSGMYFATYQTFLDPSYFRSIVKSMPVAIMAARIWKSERRAPLSDRVMAGLCLCSIADFAINANFVVGLGVFLLGHVAYIAGMRLDVESYSLPRVLPVVFYAGSVFAVFVPNLQALLIPVAVYMLTIAVMLATASNLPLNQQHGKQMAFGALCFALSDTLIGIDKFVMKVEHAGIPIMVLYWIGQALITRGALFRLDQISGSTPAETHKNESVGQKQKET